MFLNFKKMNKNENRNQNQRGFTLVETLIAISIFTTSVLAMMVVLGGQIIDINYAKNKIKATFLAQEGIEYVRNLRDEKMFFTVDSNNANKGWEDFKISLGNISDLDNTNDGCYVETFNQNEKNGCQIENPSLSPSFSNYSVDPELKNFTRFIKVVVKSDNELNIYSTIFWTQASGEKYVTFSETLLNWYGQK
jgi:prepilin-type N-terminal cleavage/methylation domain-containing protein